MSTMPRNPRNVSSPPNEDPPTAKTPTSSASATIMMPIPIMRMGRRPIRSMLDMDMKTASSAATWTSAGRPSLAKYPDIPMASKIRGP
ncbi:Uncharacterised protein [Mycobacteroides abscessus subsp. abscessus]|nr:Uncharacterised protein [Mycobacteroides abscessus subsp. abscessus]